jgi:NTE family protein
MARPFKQPDVLVLGGGGVLGEVWMSSVLAGIEETAGFDARECSGFVGTSAGSIVAAALAGGLHATHRLGALPEQPSAEEEPRNGHRPSAADRALRVGLSIGAAVAAPVATLALNASEPGGAFVRRAALARVPRGRRSLGGMGRTLDQLGVGFDGRLAVSAVDLESGRRVMFGQADAPVARVGEAVEASCAIPGFFSPVRIGGRDYVDGGAWSPTNMDRAPVSRGTGVLCLNPTGTMGGSVTSPRGALAVASRSVAGLEALALERRGASVRTISPDAGAIAAIGPNLMDSRPRRRVIAAGLEQGRRIGRGEA